MTKNAYRVSATPDPLFQDGVVRSHDSSASSCHHRSAACRLGWKQGALAALIRRQRKTRVAARETSTFATCGWDIA
ncbi:hypothetical protein OKW35_003549 [Paraburkholderia sp. MM5477-R1]